MSEDDFDYEKENRRKPAKRARPSRTVTKFEESEEEEQPENEEDGESNAEDNSELESDEQEEDSNSDDSDDEIPLPSFNKRRQRKISDDFSDEARYLYSYSYVLLIAF